MFSAMNHSSPVSNPYDSRTLHGNFAGRQGASCHVQNVQSVQAVQNDTGRFDGLNDWNVLNDWNPAQ
jgi:hypothetical protein